MDLALLSASAALTVVLPRELFQSSPSKKSEFSLPVALGLSFCLISLSILEAAPPTWLVFLHNQEPRGRSSSPWPMSLHHYIATRDAYWIVLWALSLLILLVLPALLATHFVSIILSNSQKPDPDERKYSRFFLWRNQPLWIHYILLFLFMILRIARRVFVMPFNLLFRRLSRRYSQRPSETAVSEKDPETGGVTQLGSTNRSTSTNGNSTASPPTTKKFKSVNGFLLMLCNIAAVAATLLLLGFVGPLVVETTVSNRDHPLALVVSWLCAVGVILSSVLNGFGSVSLPYSFLAGLFLEPIRAEVIAKAELELKNTEASLESRRRELLDRSSVSGSKTTSRQRGNTIRSFVGLGDAFAQRRRALESEVQFLETLCEELREDIAEMHYSQQMAAVARTPLGKAKSWIGLAFSLVLVLRLFAASMSIWKSYSNPSAPLSSQKRGDPITSALLWLIGQDIVASEEYDTLSQFISLVLTAFLSFSQLRVFLRTAAAVNRRLQSMYRKCSCPTAGSIKSSSGAADADSNWGNGDATSHLLASLVGCYCLACIVLTKMNIPSVYSRGFFAALGSSHRHEGGVFLIHTSVVNATFALSAVLSVAILGLLFGIQRQNTHRHAWNEDTANTKALGNLDAC